MKRMKMTGNPRVMRSVRTWMICGLLVGLCLPHVGHTAGGNLDPTFGAGGVTLTDFGSADVAFAVALDASGRIVTAGEAFNTSNGWFSFGVTRHQADGSLDTSFGSGGKVTTDFAGGRASIAYDVAIDGQGRIVAAGNASMPTQLDDGRIVFSSVLALARYNGDGSPDSGFGPDGSGRITIDLPDAVGDDGLVIHEIFNDMIIDASGRITALVTQPRTGNHAIAMVRYDENGILDPSFGDGGIVQGAWTNARGRAMALDASGRLVVSMVIDGNSTDIGLARYNGDGSPDSSFGSGGYVTVDLDGAQYADAVAIDSAGRIVLAGTSQDSFFVARYTASGVPDTGFNGNGFSTVAVGGLGLSFAQDVIIDAHGGIIAVGYSATPDFNTAHVALARFLEDGTPDGSFGSGGGLTTPLRDYAAAWAGALDTDGNIVVAGEACAADAMGPDILTCDFAVARYVNGTSAYVFSGFFPPVDNPPTLNVVKAGRAIPVKFSLNGDYGLDILAAGSPASQTVPCDTGTAQDVLSETVSAGESSLTYDAEAGQYVYIWKTDKSWANSCRQLVVTLNDGTSRVAKFRFSK